MALGLRFGRWLGLAALVLCVSTAAREAAAEVEWDPIDGSTDFEDPANWDAETYDPVPTAGNELAPPGPDSNFFINGANQTVILENERTANTTKLGTFTIGAGTYTMDDPGTPETETVGPGDEISTFIILNSVTFTTQERNPTGTVVTRPIRIGHEDNQPETRLNGELDFPWGIVLHKAGTFLVESNTTNTNDQIRMGSNENAQGGSLYEISGTAKLNVATDKFRVGDRANATSSANSVFRVRGSTMGTSKTDPAIRIGDDFELESTSGLWDYDRVPEYENRPRFNRGKGIVEFVLDEGGVTPIVAIDAFKIGDEGAIPDVTPDAPNEGVIIYTPGFLRVKLSRPLLPTTPGMAGQSPLNLIWADRLTTTTTNTDLAVGDPTPYPLYQEMQQGRFFDPDRDGEAVVPNGAPDPAPHKFLSNNATVISDYAGATYTWNIEYFEDGSGADNGVIDSYVRLVNGVLSGTLGDLNGDTMLNTSDRQELIDAIAAPPDRHLLLGQRQHLFDLNADDFVDQLDLDLFNTYFLAPDLEGDHNKDEVVDAADYVAWRKLGIDGAAGYQAFVENFNETLSGAGGGGAVPEPATAVLMLLAAAMIRLRPQR